MADGAMPVTPNQDCGRSASLCSSRAIFTNSRNGWAARKTATWAGTSASKRALTRHAPALVDSELVGVFQIVEKRQMHRAGFVERSQPPDLLAARDASTKCAFVNAAISASVDEGGCSKNSAAPFHPSRSGR